MACLVDWLLGFWQPGLFGLVPDFQEPVSSWLLWLVLVLVVLLPALSFLLLYIPGQLVLGVIVPVPIRLDSALLGVPHQSHQGHCRDPSKTAQIALWPPWPHATFL